MSDQAVRDHLIYLLSGGGAHLPFDHAIGGIPSSMRGASTDGSTHTPWRLLEHLRICQWDILQFSIDPDHVSPTFPDGYWPQGDTPPDDLAWDRSVEGFRNDLKSMIQLVADPVADLYEPLAHGTGQTILREALLVADHNAYHLGQLVFLRRCLGIWEE